MIDNPIESKYISWKRKFISKVEDNFANIFMFLLLLLVFLICLYRIFGTRNYDLKYTYYLAGVSLYLIILVSAFTAALKQIEERKVKGKRYNRIIVFITSVFSIITLSISLYSFISLNISSPREVTLKDLVVPEGIWVSKVSDSDSFMQIELEFETQEDSEIIIKSCEDIQKILNDLESKEIKNISIIDVFNFLRLKNFNKDNYTMFFEYEDYYMGYEGLRKGYISYITIASNGEMMIEERYDNYENFSLGGQRIAYYPINFSDETMDLIKSYIDKADQAYKK